MAYVPVHPTLTATIRRRSIANVAGTKRRVSYSTVGTIVGAGFENITGSGLRTSVAGQEVLIKGRLYADADLDLPVLRGDVVELTDPATAQARVFDVVERRGPWGNSTEDDHFELDLSDRKSGGTR